MAREKEVRPMLDYIGIYKQLGGTNVLKMPLAQQPAELERRLQYLFDICRIEGIAPSTPAMQVILGIDRRDMDCMAKGVDTNGVPYVEHKAALADPTIKTAYEQRTEIINRALTTGAAMCFDRASSGESTAANLFTLKSCYDYREVPDQKEITAAVRFEDLAQAVRDAAKEMKRAEQEARQEGDDAKTS